jgi:hypothetical protein
MHVKAAALPKLRSTYAARSNNVAIWEFARPLCLWMPSLWWVAHRRRLGADRMKTADALMVVYYVLLSGVLVFTLGYLAGWRQAKRR